MPKHDFVCTKCGNIDAERHFERWPDGQPRPADAWPRCSMCDGVTTVWYGHGRAPEFMAFGKRIIGQGKVVEDADEWRRWETAIKIRHGHDVEIHVEPCSPEQRQREADEIRHELWEDRKARGIDDYAMKQGEERRKAAEEAGRQAALKTNTDPALGAKAAAEATPSVAETVQQGRKPLLADRAKVIVSAPATESG